ncbi:MAG: SGNH/GDSL hydrolase family protein [Planctomycetes bacterium]|nr:SGNH/GDSL hydrolase family protein [Planctomycetota bacterium]
MPRAIRTRKLLLAAAVLVAGLLAVEAAARVRFYLQYGTFFRVHTFAVDPASGLRIPPPSRDTGAIRIDERGFRGEGLDVPKPAGRVRLAFLGASTTFCAEASSNAATWPSLVVAALRAAHPAADLDFVNAGVAGYVLDDLLKNLEHRVAPLAPDVVVIYEATNDLTKWTRELAREQGVYTGHADGDSWLSETSLAWHLVEKNLLVRARQQQAASAAGRLVLDEARIVPPFRERLERLVARARELAPCVVLVTFAQAARAGQDAREREQACVTHAYYMPYISHAAVVQGFAAYNRVIREVARHQGVGLVEGEDTIPADRAHFADSVHFTDLGSRAQAQRVAAGLLADGCVSGLLAR